MPHSKKDGYTLGIDFGTSNTVAVVREPDGTVRTLSFDGSYSLPSAVVQLPAGEMLTGTVALRQRRLNSELQLDVPHPKSLIGQQFVDGTEVPVTSVVAAVLRRVREEYESQYGAPQRVIITYPTHWTNPRCNALKEAAREAGFAEIETKPESTAAAAYYAQEYARGEDFDKPILVYDLGAGTFDVSLIRPGPQGFQQLHRNGNGHLGGSCIDQKIVDAVSADSPDADDGVTEEYKHFAHSKLWEDARELKETLSSTDEGSIFNERSQLFYSFNRDQLELAAAETIDETIAISQDVIRRSGVAPHEVDKVLLVGGATRMPLVKAKISESIGEPVTIHGHPESVVVNGSLVDSDSLDGSPPPASRPERVRPQLWANHKRRLIAGASALLLVFAAITGYVILREPDPYGLPDGDGRSVAIGVMDWPDSIAVTELWYQALEESGYDVTTVEYFEVSHIFEDLAAGNIDLFFNGWFPITHGEYLDRYRGEFSSIGTWYSEASLVVAIAPSVRQVNSLDELNEYAELFDGRLIGIEEDAGITHSVRDYTIPEYGLDSFVLETNTTDGMLNSLDRAMEAGDNVAVTLWEPHYALQEHQLKVLEDPQGTLGGEESIEILSSHEFEDEFPDLARKLSQFHMSEDSHRSLQSGVFRGDHRSDADAVEEWLDENSFQDLLDD